jgi:polyhydroxybutyrate depolymerase
MRTPFAGCVSILFVGSVLFACSEEASEPPASGSGGVSPATGGASSAVGGMGGGLATGGSNSGGAPAASGGAPANSGGAPAASGGAPAASGGRANPGGATAGTGTAGSSAAGAENSDGCGRSGAATGVLSSEQIEIEGTARTYVLSIPTDYQANRAYPLVFAWHGLGGSGSGARAYFRIEQQGKGNALFVYPDGLPNDDGNAGWDLAVNGVDVTLFDELVTKIGASHCVDRSRVFSTGHSFGGFFTERLGCSRGEALRAIAPVAGGPPFGGMTNCTSSVAAWITHGSNDETVEIETGEAGRDLWLEANGCGMTTTTTAPEPCVAYDGCQEPVHWCVHEDGHNWPSFAGAAIWSFFSSL